MKHILGLLFVLLIVSVVLPNAALCQSKPNVRAQEGEKVYVIINYVKDECRKDYECFMNEVFFDILANSKNEQTQKALRTSRWLIPEAQNEDNTWSYIFIIDPVIENATYNIDSLFRERYNATEAMHLIKRYESFMVGLTHFYSLKQSKY